MKTWVVSSLAVAAGIVASAQAQPAPTKVGIIHIQKAIVTTKEGQKAAEAMELRHAPKRKELEKKQSDVQALQENLRRQSNTASEEVKQRLMREIDARTKSFNRDMEDAQADLDQDQNRILQELGGKIMAVIDKYARDNGYSLVLDVSAQNTPVLFAATSIDLTDEIIALYDKSAPTAAQPSAAKPAPAAPPPVAPAKKAPALPKP